MADLPWADWSLRLHLNVRKFRCPSLACRQKVFCERLPSLVAPWARRTLRLANRQRQLGFALGGAPGERLSHKLETPVGRNTLLRLVRTTPRQAQPTPRILGVDDWAKRKGQTYGTILVDLEHRRPIELLPDREASTLAAWLEAHPGVEIVARDRAGTYADGAASGAPGAQQVADRFHLLRNLADALQGGFERHTKLLRAKEAPETTLPALHDPFIAAATSKPEAEIVALGPSLPLADSAARRQKRLKRYERVQELYWQGWTLRAIATHLKLNRATVRRYAQAEAFPELNRAARKLDPFKPYLLARWNEGCRTGTLLYEEIKKQGYEGKRGIVQNYLTRLRKAQGLPPRARYYQPGSCVMDSKTERLTPRQATWLVLRKPEKLRQEDEALITRFREAHPELDETITLALDFAEMLRERQADLLDRWLTRVEQSISGVFRHFAKGLRRDYSAVKAAFTESWSTGPVEGHINRLKMLKRQMYGRAKLDLLEQRFLNAA